MLRFEESLEDVSFIKHRAEAIQPSDPRLLLLNHQVARELKVEGNHLERVLSGSIIPEGARPVALAYAGHQFGHFVPVLGDGRALLLGEIRAEHDGLPYDIQLKGSGPTVFSRGGDGLLSLGPALREYLISEAMAHLKVPTTRSLSVVLTGDDRRDGALGAVLARIAQSHLRIGTFEYASRRASKEQLLALTHYALKKLYPSHYVSDPMEAALSLFDCVMRAQASLVARWMSVGFIHGVMNTDNVALSGETLDYGPCAFMDTYQANRVYSSIDVYGRYAYENQPKILVWNLARFAECLIPNFLMAGLSAEKAIETLNEKLSQVTAIYDEAWLKLFTKKIGIATIDPEYDHRLINKFLELLEIHHLDFTNSFKSLAAPESMPQVLSPWRDEWMLRLEREELPLAAIMEDLRLTNPSVIPRNHLVEDALSNAASGDMGSFNALLGVVQNPFGTHPDIYSTPPGDAEWGYKTYCGT